MASQSRKLTFADILIREFAGHPLRVCLNIILTTATGVLLAHFVMGAALSESTVFGSLVAPLIAILLAGALKEEQDPRDD